MPKQLIELLASPADLTVVDRGKVVRQLESIRAGLLDREDRPKLDRFVALVEDGLGFSLYEAVESAKRRLSEISETPINVDEPSLAITETATRSELDRVAEKPVAAILEALDKTLETAGISADEIDIACLTGGTSRMPLVAAAIAARLPRTATRRLRSFHSVVVGLAHRAREIAEKTP